MNKLFITIFFLFCFSTMIGQQNHFVYLQTYNNQPFYLRLDGKVMSSSATGYLIVPKLTNSSYQFIIGFAKNEWPEQVFYINIKGNLGYELKNFPDKGWGLYDLQNAEVIMGGNTNVVSPAAVNSTPKKNDAFADMLSNVVNDSTIRVDDRPVAKTNVSNKSAEEEKMIVSNTARETTAVTEILYSDVKKTMDNRTADGLERIYIDNNGKYSDTIRVFIPETAEKIQVSDEKKIVPAKANEIETAPAKNDPPPVKTAIDTVSASAPKFIEDVEKKPAQSVSENKSPDKNGLTMINSDCHATASEEDFFKLRKRMAAVNNDEEMIKIARKAFKSKCYSTSNIKNLSVLFLTDQGRYTFFDASYPFVSDSQNFPGLEKELTDNYYITRFRAMIHK